jgi:hypothetical protein
MSVGSLEQFVLPKGVAFDDLRKVTVWAGGATHVTSPWYDGATLCGRRWWFECNLGTYHYCRLCQAKLAKIRKANPVSTF